MTITELVNELTYLLETEGDVDVRVLLRPSGGHAPIESIRSTYLNHILVVPTDAPPAVPGEGVK